MSAAAQHQEKCPDPAVPGEWAQGRVYLLVEPVAGNRGAVWPQITGSGLSTF